MLPYSVWHELSSKLLIGGDVGFRVHCLGSKLLSGYTGDYIREYYLGGINGETRSFDYSSYGSTVLMLLVAEVATEVSLLQPSSSRVPKKPFHNHSYGLGSFQIPPKLMLFKC